MCDWGGDCRDTDLGMMGKHRELNRAHAATTNSWQSTFQPPIPKRLTLFLPSLQLYTDHQTYLKMVRDVSGQAQLSPNRVTRSQTRAQSTTNNHDATNMEGESFMMEPGASETYLLDSNSSFIADMLSTSTMFGASMTSPPSPKRGNRRRTPSPSKRLLDIGRSTSDTLICA